MDDVCIKYMWYFPLLDKGCIERVRNVVIVQRMYLIRRLVL